MVEKFEVYINESYFEASFAIFLNTSFLIFFLKVHQTQRTGLSTLLQTVKLSFFIPEITL